MVIKEAAPVKKVAAKRAPIRAAAKRPVSVKRVSKNVGFPPPGGRVSKYPSSMSESQKKRAGGKSSHRERVLMRALLRKKGIVGQQESNTVADKWLQSHGYLHSTGYEPPKNRVRELSRSLGYKRRPTVKQLGIK